MSCGESFQDRQISELNVLKSIFGDELKDLRKNKQKKKCQPLDIIITLTPQEGSSGPIEANAQIDLHITCGERYPESIPKIQLKNSRGLSDQQVAEHLKELEELAKKLKGEVMIFDLAQQVKKFLHENNKPGYTSCYDEMVSKREEKKQSELQEKQMKEDKERQVLQDEISKRKAELRQEFRYRRESMRLSQSLDAEQLLSSSIPSSPHERIRAYSRRRCLSSSESSDVVFQNRNSKIINFDCKGKHQVHHLNFLGHSIRGSVVYSGVDMATGELLAVTMWTFKCESSDKNNKTHDVFSNNIQHTVKQLMSIEQELNHLQRLQHPNLVHYLNMTYSQDEDNVIAYVLQEFVVGTTCSVFLSENIPIEIDMLRYLAIGILTALSYLHENNVVHKDLRDSSVYITSKGTVKLSDYSLDKRLSDIYQTSCLEKMEQDFPTVQGRGGKKADIYRFGILLLSLYKGAIVSDRDIKEISSLHTITNKSDLRDFIAKCLLGNERSRWSAEQLLEHRFIKIPLERGLTPPRLNCINEQKRNQPEQEPDNDIHMHLPAFEGQSRIHNEFQVLKWLGKGAFGDVLKVKNKLDGGIYAIKRIELNPKNKLLNRKITREVKLLSRLNHENVVRYYNSWIESGKYDKDRDNQYTPCTTPSINKISSPIAAEKTSNLLKNLDNADIEKLVPPIYHVEWNSYKSRLSTAVTSESEEDNSDNSSDSESDEEWNFVQKKKMENESSSSIEFERDGEKELSNEFSHCLIQEKDKKEEIREVFIKEIQFMYIQMEFCEKSTLRIAIDNGLYKEEERMWRLFREIIEGLCHIHQQGMIHRDLKPVNIFLDSYDHVKIGDFGLATSNVLSSYNLAPEIDKESHITDKGESMDLDELGSMTGQVGTALYAAPELTVKGSQAIYNQKVDLYSLGIMFFEMCYKPLQTGMERVKILSNLRCKEIILPNEMTEIEMSSKVHLIRWLLNHDPSQRPTSQELLMSEYLPPLRVEETELQEMVRWSLSNTKSRAYKCLINCCFKQEFTPAEDITYDMNLPARGVKSYFNQETQILQEVIKLKVIEIFQKHGGTYIFTPLLMPKSRVYSNITDSCVRLMTRNGNIVSVPHDLRVPFARYVVWNNISNIRRYAIDRVYREKKVAGFHPRELYECAFDIISSIPNNLMSEAELIYIAWEIFNEIPQLQERDLTVRINHTSLLHAVFEYCGVEKERYNDIYSILHDALNGKFSKIQLHTHLFSLCLKDQAMETLYNLLDVENSVPKITSILKTISKRKGDIGELAKEGLQKIETVISHAKSLGITWSLVIVPVLVHNNQQYDGIFFQITCNFKRKRRIGQDVIAAGGRYDKMLGSFQKVLARSDTASKDTKKYGVGISISLEKLVGAVGEWTEEFIKENKFPIEIAVCCIDEESNKKKEFADVLKELWSLDLRVTCLDYYKVEEVFEYCREHNINHVVIYKPGEKETVRIQTWERDKFQERKISIKDISEYFQKQNDVSIPVTMNKSDTKINSNNDTSIPNVETNFLFPDDDKISANTKRSYKNNIYANISSYIQRISSKVPIEVLGVMLEMSVVRTITNYLEIDDDQEFHKSVQVIIDMHSRHKKYIAKICDQLREMRNQKLRPVIIVYSLMDFRYLTLL